MDVQTEADAKLDQERKEKEAALQAPPPTPNRRDR